MNLLLLYISLALGLSFLCSIMEAVLLSVTPSFVVQMEKERPRLGRRLKSMKNDVDRPLAAILSLNTIAHTVGAAGAGAQAAAVFGDAYVGVISAILTLLILVISEIIPKTLGAVYWRELTPWVLRLLVPTIWSMWPLVKMSQGLTGLLAAGKRERVSREELAALAEMGAREGVMHENESRILANLFRLERVQVGDIMTPRTVIFALPETWTVGEVLENHPKIRFSRIPIFASDRDEITGFVLKVDLLLRAAEHQKDTPLTELRRPLAVAPKSLTLRRLFDRLMNERDHLALVVDEYGGTEGLVTLEDLLETLLGLEIVDEADAVHDMQLLARRKWTERARRLGLVLEDSEESAKEKDAKEPGEIKSGH